MDNGVLIHLLPALAFALFCIMPAGMFVFALFYAIFKS
jgi:hypothetical protein